MDEPGFKLEEASVTLIGLGLMGGSLALCLKDHCKRLNALDLDVQTLALARRMGVVHAAGSDPRGILPGADLIILACPIPGILDWLKRVPDYVEKDCVILDIGSSKRAILSTMQELPARFDPLGGHAICGKEKITLANAERDLYRDATFVLTPLARTGAAARSAALQLIALLGARPLWMDADRHDAALAATSHLPYLISSALSMSMPQGIARELVGPGFRSTARLAGTPSSMMSGVLEANRDYVLNEIHTFQKSLAEIEDALQLEDSNALKSTLDAARSRYLEMTM